MNKTTVLAATVALIVGIGAGTWIGIANHTPTQEQVLSSLYEHCVNGTGYAPEAKSQTTPIQCNRESIDLFMASVYSGSYMPPIDPAAYEAKLLAYKHKTSEPAQGASQSADGASQALR